MSKYLKLWWLPLLLLGAVIALFELTNLDLFLQDFFYNFETKKWMLGSDDVWARFIFYDFVKRCLVLFAVILLILLLLPDRYRAHLSLVAHVEKRRFAMVLLSLLLIPSLVGIGKNVTDVYFPRQILRYGGDKPYVKLLESFPKDFPRKGKGHGFPAGHASGGFALMSLYFLFRSKRARFWGLCGGFALGWIMGGFQTLNGNHYLSHTLVTICLAWFVILVLARMLKLKDLE